MLTPVFTADLETERAHAEQSGIAALLDSDVDPSSKLDLASGSPTGSRPRATRCRWSGPAFEPLPDDPAEREATVALRNAIESEIDRAATHAFSSSFLIAAGFALAALLPIALARRERSSCEAEQSEAEPRRR